MDILTANDTIGKHPNSWYAATASTPVSEHQSAEGQVHCDVCIVGGGFTGLSAAFHLADRGYDVVLLEANRIGSGASGRNGGQVGMGQRVEQDALEKMVGQDRARALWTIGSDAVALVKTLIEDNGIDGRFVPGIIHADHRKRYVRDSHDYAKKLQDEYDYDLIRGIDQDEMRHLVGSPAYYGGVLDMGGGHIHPLSFALGLAQLATARGVRIFERSRVNTIEPSGRPLVKTDKADICADHIILACNGYLGNLDGRVAARVMPINNFVVATETLSEATAEGLIRQNYAVADSKFVVNYFRLTHDRRLLFGGDESYGYRFPDDIAKKIRKPMVQIYPQLKDTKIDYAWGGTLGITMNRMPHFERRANNILSVSGYSGHGVAMATLGGKMAADAICGQAERFDIMADVPTPKFPGGVAMRWPLLVLAMVWYSLRDRL